MKHNFEEMEVEQLLKKGGYECECGTVHNADTIEFLAVGEGAINRLPEALEVCKAKKVMVVSGVNVAPTSGKIVCGMLDELKMPYSLYVFPDNNGRKMQPTEHAVEAVVNAFDKECNVLLAVGSGSVSDVCKAVATKLSVPQLTVGTAPSMDGYLSASSSLEINNTKASISENPPTAVICDIGIMSEAPMCLLQAGLGDMLAKCSARCEWKIVSYITNEHYCEEVSKMVKKAYNCALAGAAGLQQRNREAVKSVIRGLLISGIGMTYMGNSRPASGLEHYFSHCWEMMAIDRGQEYNLHGIYVGIGTIITAKIYEWLKEVTPSREVMEKAAASFDAVAWEARVRRVFPGIADGLIELENKKGKNKYEGRLARFNAIEENWDEMVKTINREIPAYDELEKVMLSAGMQTKPAEIGLTVDDVADAFVCSRDVRDKYLLSSLIWDLGLMDEFEKKLRSWLS